MALRLGIGDAFTICKGAVDLCKAIHDEPAEVHSVIAEMKLMRAHLNSLESKIGDEKSFAATRPDITPVMKRSLEPLHKDLSDIKTMLHECTRKTSVHVVDKVRYLVLYKAKFHSFQEKLPIHRESICVIQEMIEEQSPSERRASILKLSELAEAQERQDEKQDDYNIAQKEVVKIFEERFPCADHSRHMSTRDMLEHLEDHLIVKGTSFGEEETCPSYESSSTSLPSGETRSESNHPAPVFRLDVFESESHCITAGSLHKRKSRESLEYRNANTPVCGPDIPEVFWDNQPA